MKKIVVILFFLVLFSFFPVKKTFAITKANGDLQVTYDSPLFPLSTVWYPGLSVTKSITVKNIGKVIHTTSTKATNTLQTGNIAELYLFKITEEKTTRYGDTDYKTMKRFWDAGEVNLSNINQGNSTRYDILVTMPDAAGNEYQGKTAGFDLIIGFVGTESKVTVPGVLGVNVSPTSYAKSGTVPVLGMGWKKIILLGIPLLVIIFIVIFLRKRVSQKTSL